MRGPSRRRELRRQCQTMVRELGLSAPFDLELLCERLGRRRGRAIRLLPWSLPVPGPTGLWIARSDEDVIVFQRQTSRAHQQHIVLHEIGHIVQPVPEGCADHGEELGSSAAESRAEQFALTMLAMSTTTRQTLDLGARSSDGRRRPVVPQSVGGRS